ncbi:ubiquitin carboxyl-terminal hydrolase [Apiospora arundinis]|uniref:Uncharacterized protein n=1 Tax=Apiospora arundinis TaxID=335852 RepID=A0ABR2II06_9PEZI
MDVASAINAAAKQIVGLDFGSGRPFHKPALVFAAFVGDHANQVVQGMTQGDIAETLENRLTTMASHATRGHDIFTRLRSHSAFYVYVALEMNPLSPISATEVE